MQISKASQIELLQQNIRKEFKVDLITQNTIYLNLNKLNQILTWLQLHHKKDKYAQISSVFFKKVYQAKALYLGWNDCQNILQIIEDSMFPNLKELTLNGNNIVSIQNFQKIMLPSLSSLEICTNFICDFSTLRKCNFSKSLCKMLLVQNIFNIFQRSFTGLTELSMKECQTLIICTYRDDCYKNTQLQTHPKFYQSLVKMQSLRTKIFFTTPHIANDKFITERFGLQKQD